MAERSNIIQNQISSGLRTHDDQSLGMELRIDQLPEKIAISSQIGSL